MWCGGWRREGRGSERAVGMARWKGWACGVEELRDILCEILLGVERRGWLIPRELGYPRTRAANQMVALMTSASGGGSGEDVQVVSGAPTNNGGPPDRADTFERVDALDEAIEEQQGMLWKVLATLGASGVVAGTLLSNLAFAIEQVGSWTVYFFLGSVALLGCGAGILGTRILWLRRQAEQEREKLNESRAPTLETRSREQIE